MCQQDEYEETNPALSAKLKTQPQMNRKKKYRGFNKNANASTEGCTRK